MSFTPYQVDYAVQNTAKTMGFSKKKVIFKFGFANEASLRERRSGADCRGSEHEVVFIWSLKTGKRELLVDGKRVHFSESGQNGWTVDRSWTFKFTLTDKSTHHRYKIQFLSQSTSRETPHIKPFDLIISGLSYFQFNPIYELGAKNMIVMPLEDSMTRHIHGGSSQDMDPEERRQLAAAKLASLRDIQQQQQPASPPKMPPKEEELISFDNDEQAPPRNLHGSGMQRASSLTLDPAIDDKLPAPYPMGAPPPPPPANNNNNIYAAAAAPNPYAPSTFYAANTSTAGATNGSNYSQNPYAMVPVANSPSVSYGVDATGRLAVQQQETSQSNNPFANPYAAAPATSYGGGASYGGGYGGDPASYGRPRTATADTATQATSFAYGQAPGPSPSFGQAPAQSYGQATSQNPGPSYGQAPGPSTSYGQAPGQLSSFGQAPAPSTSYGQAPGPSAPYGQQSSVSPTSHAQASAPSFSYGQAPAPTGQQNPYGQQQQAPNPYGQQQQQQQASNPYGQQQQAPPPAFAQPPPAFAAQPPAFAQPPAY